MMNYRKGRNIEEELTRNDIKIENLPEDFLWMHVSFWIFASFNERYLKRFFCVLGKRWNSCAKCD